MYIQLHSYLWYVHIYLEDFLTPRHFFFLTTITITMQDIKVMKTTVDTVPAIVGRTYELEVGVELVIGGCSITIRIIGS